jgi:hypothetical protein
VAKHKEMKGLLGVGMEGWDKERLGERNGIHDVIEERHRQEAHKA